MKSFLYKQVIGYLFLLPLFFLLSACSDKQGYLNTIPSNSMALVAVDVQEIQSKDIVPGFVGKAFGAYGFGECGIDLSAKLYLFETVEGNIGMSAKVDDKNALDDWLNKMSEKGVCRKTEEYKDFRFTVISNSWVVGFSSDALVAMGPALPSQQGEVRRQIAKCLEQDESDGIKGTQLFARLDSIDAPVSLVAQAASLPEKFVSPFMLGAPKEADASQIMIAAGLGLDNSDCWVIRGGTFSFNKEVNEKLENSRDVFRPITASFARNIPADAAVGVLMNVDGGRFITLLHENRGLQALLGGANAAIDMDNVIKSIDGDVILSMSDVSKGVSGLNLCAQLKSKSFLEDVGYWKQSCPPGFKIEDWKKDGYCLSSDGLSVYFGVSDDMKFYAGSTPESASGFLSEASEPLSTDIVNIVKGQKIALVINADAIAGQLGLGRLGMFSPSVKTILFIVE